MHIFNYMSCLQKNDKNMKNGNVEAKLARMQYYIALGLEEKKKPM